MKSILSLEAPAMVLIINDGAQSANVFPFVGEKMGGVLNASQAVASLSAAAFFPIPAQLKRKGGTVVAGTLDWRPALIT